jgi:hypothetical protein
LNRIRLYLDEDAMLRDLIIALRDYDVPAVTVRDAGLVGAPDETQLTFAAAQGLVLYSFNRADFQKLHTAWMDAGRAHAGIILAPQQRFSSGEQLRRILRLRAAKTAEDLCNQIEFLSKWG